MKESKDITNTMKIIKLSSQLVDSKEGKGSKQIEISYVRANGATEKFTIKPLDIDNEICYGLDMKTNDIKEFVINRITEIVTNEWEA